MPISSTKIKIITHTALYLSLAILLPVGFHSFGIAGRLFLPMHIPVLLAGFLIGPVSGIAVGLMAPGLSYLLTGMPPTYAVPLMSLELPIYGLIAGLCYRRLKLNVYISLGSAMLVGRIMFGLSLTVLSLFIEVPYTTAAFFSTGGAIVTSFPGIALQIVLVPLIVAAGNRKKS